MSHDQVPDEIKEFIHKYIDSVEQLDTLMLLFQSAPQPWTAEGISQNLRCNLNSVSRRLTALHSMGLLVTDDKVSYWFDINSKKKDMVHQLAETYRERRYTILNLIFSRPIDVLRSFSDAFKIKKEGPNDG